MERIRKSLRQSLILWAFPMLGLAGQDTGLLLQKPCSSVAEALSFYDSRYPHLVVEKKDFENLELGADKFGMTRADFERAAADARNDYPSLFAAPSTQATFRLDARDAIDIFLDGGLWGNEAKGTSTNMKAHLHHPSARFVSTSYVENSFLLKTPYFLPFLPQGRLRKNATVAPVFKHKLEQAINEPDEFRDFLRNTKGVIYETFQYGTAPTYGVKLKEDPYNEKEFITGGVPFRHIERYRRILVYQPLSSDFHHQTFSSVSDFSNKLKAVASKATLQLAPGRWYPMKGIEKPEAAKSLSVSVAMPPAMQGKPVGKLKPLPVSNKQGSTGGKWYEDEANVRWFVKHDVIHPELQTASEVIVSQIYRHLGYKTSQSAIVEVEGKRAVAVKDFGPLPLSVMHGANDRYAKALRIFAAYVKDWDRLRVGPNNAVREDGHYLLFDFGGSLGARAQGEHKPGQVFSRATGSFSPSESFSEIIDGMRTDWLPDDHVWREPIDPATAKRAREKLTSLTNAHLSQFVDNAHYSRPSDAAYMKQALIERRDTLIVGLKQLEEGVAKPLTLTLPYVKPTQDESIALTHYVGDASNFILNPILLGKKIEPEYLKQINQSANLPEEVKKSHITALKRLAERTPDFPIGLEIYRGKTTTRNIVVPKEGDKRRSEIFLSTSLDPMVAKGYILKGNVEAGKDREATAIYTTYRIASKGVKGIYVPHFQHDFTNSPLGKNAAALSQSENEVLFPPGILETVVSVEYKDLGNGRRVIIQTVELTRD